MTRMVVLLVTVTVLLGFAIPVQANTIYLPTAPVKRMSTYKQANQAILGTWSCDHQIEPHWGTAHFVLTFMEDHVAFHADALWS